MYQKNNGSVKCHIQAQRHDLSVGFHAPPLRREKGSLTELGQWQAYFSKTRRRDCSIILPTTVRRIYAYVLKFRCRFFSIRSKLDCGAGWMNLRRNKLF